MHLRSRMQIFHKNVKLYPAFWKYALCLIVCTWSHYLAGRMCTPSKYVCYFTRRFESIYCVWSVASICTLLIYVWWKQKLIQVLANLYVLSKPEASTNPVKDFLSKLILSALCCMLSYAAERANHRLAELGENHVNNDKIYDSMN